MAKHSKPGSGNPDQKPGKHTTEAKPQSKPALGRITRDLYEGVRGDINQGHSPER